MYGKETSVNAKAMRAQGMSYNDIAHALGINKRTANAVRKMLAKPGISTVLKGNNRSAISGWNGNKQRFQAKNNCM